MADLKRVLICPFFGPLPPWFNKFEIPKNYHIIIDTDLNDFKLRVKQKLGIEYPGVWGSGKIHDYRCTLGLLYQEEIKSYDYWGTVDLDMCFGEVDKWFPDEMINQYDVVSNHDTYVSGPFSLYKNTQEVNELFFKVDWKKYLINPESNAWVENEFSRLLEQSGLKFKYMSEQGNPWCKNLNLKKENEILYQDGIPIAMFHFRHFKHLGWPL